MRSHHLLSVGGLCHGRYRLAGAAALVAMGVSFTTGIGPASAVDPVSQSQGRFLGGSAAGVDLDTLLSVLPADAVNAGGPQQTTVNPLSVAALNAVAVDLGGGVNLLGNNGILSVGAVNQYAQASPDGSSRAVSGAVDNSGAVAVGGSSAYPANASFDLAPLIGAGLAATIGDLDLTVGALTGAADQSAGGVQSGDYQIASLSLALTSPLVAGITSGLTTSLTALQPVVNGLPALIRALPAVGPLATVTGLPNLAALVGTLGTVTSSDGSITANLTTGAVTIDVAQVLSTAGLALNDLPPNTELLPYITAALTSQLLPAITTALQDLITDITDAIDGISVSVLGVPIPLAVLAPVLAPVITQVTTPITTVVAGLGTSVITPLAGALTGLVSLRANVQESTAGGVFTERALQVGLVPAGPLAVVNLASASVGPNAGPLVAPVASSLTPSSGPDAGGQTVTVTGSGFVPAATSVTIGGTTIPATDVTVASPTTLSFATPAHAAGPVDVTVTTLGGTSGPLAYTYLTPTTPPVAASLTPATGPDTGGQTVTVTGSGFVPAATSVTIGGTTIPATDVTVASSTTLSFVAPAHAAGPANITVTTAAGTSAALRFTYRPTATPSTASLSPASGQVTGGQTVTLTGSGFIPAATSVTIGGIGVPAAEVTVSSPRTLSFRTPAHRAGPVDVTVTTAAGTSAPLHFTYRPVTAADRPVVTDPTDGSTVDDPAPVISGTGTAGASIAVTEGSATVCVAVVASTGRWSCTPAFPLARGFHAFVVTQTGPDGQPSLTSTVTFAVAAEEVSAAQDVPVLAATGTEATSLAALGGALLVLGALIAFTARRPRTHSGHHG